LDIEQALQKERERIAELLHPTECPPVYIDCTPESACRDCWLAYLEPPKNPEEPAEGAES
jgi:hypothetical protein